MFVFREDWKPVLTVNSIVYGLQYLFLEPNPEDPLNKEAAEVLQSNKRLFEQNVAKSMRGGHIGSMYFERCLKWCGDYISGQKRSCFGASWTGSVLEPKFLVWRCACWVDSKGVEWAPRGSKSNMTLLDSPCFIGCFSFCLFFKVLQCGLGYRWQHIQVMWGTIQIVQFRYRSRSGGYFVSTFLPFQLKRFSCKGLKL